MSKLKELEQLLTNGKISRRDFIARVSALGLMAAVSPALLSTPAKAATPKKGGRFRMGLAGGSTTDSLDPGTLPDMVPQMANRQLRNSLVETNYKSEPIPELAESWDSSPDATKWTFKLRKGVEFHNGKTLDAEDVVWSINHHRGKDSKSAAKGIVDPIKDIKADGKDTVVFELAGGNADFPFIMSEYHLSMIPAGTKGADLEKGIGTGPYMLVSHEPGVRVFTKRNPNYWKEGRAHFDEIETIAISDVNARTNALKTGQIDAMNRCERKTFHLLKKMSELKTIVGNGTKHYTVPMITTIKPYDSNDVRLALKYAVDREQIVKTVLRGLGTVGNDHPIGRNQRYYAADLPQRKYDPDKAKFYLKKAGLEGHVFNLHAADAAFGGAVDAAVIYKENAAKAGVNINVVKEPDDGYWSNVWMKKEWSMCFWSGRVTEDWMFATAYAADAGWNDTFWKHERFNKLLVEARAELDDAKRRELYFECQKIVSDEGATVVPMFAYDLTATGKNVMFENVAADWEMDGMRAPERWWFA
jgi:peptide/nickel transport system substrate-binding protein